MGECHDEGVPRRLTISAIAGVIHNPARQTQNRPAARVFTGSLAIQANFR